MVHSRARTHENSVFENTVLLVHIAQYEGCKYTQSPYFASSRYAGNDGDRTQRRRTVHYGRTGIRTAHTRTVYMHVTFKSSPCARCVELKVNSPSKRLTRKSVARIIQSRCTKYIIWCTSVCVWCVRARVWASVRNVFNRLKHGNVTTMGWGWETWRNISHSLSERRPTKCNNSNSNNTSNTRHYYKNNINTYYYYY